MLVEVGFREYGKRTAYRSLEQQQCYQAELGDFFRLVDKRLVPDLDLAANTNQQHHLVLILQAYEQELDRLRQIIRTNEESVGIFLMENDRLTLCIGSFL